jgi:hypothetical protein
LCCQNAPVSYNNVKVTTQYNYNYYQELPDLNNKEL